MRVGAADLQAALTLLAYVSAVVMLSKPLYEALRAAGLSYHRAVYFVRKYIHVFAGGVVALLTPIAFHDPLIPLIMGVVLAAGLAIARVSGHRLYWFQVPENAYEVNFCVAWGVSIAVLWVYTGNPWLAITPALLISFGDAVTGVVRNLVVRRRSKHWIGNIAMAGVTIPLLWMMLGTMGALVAVAASLAERLEFNPIDDNVIIVVVSTALLLLLHNLGLLSTPTMITP